MKSYQLILTEETRDGLKTVSTVKFTGELNDSAEVIKSLMKCSGEIKKKETKAKSKDGE